MTSIISINGYTGATGCTGPAGIAGFTGYTGYTGTFSGIVYQDLIPYTPNTVNLGNSSNYFNGLYVTNVNVSVNDVVFANISSNMVINGTTESTSTNTGTLRVTGGVGIGANVFIGGNTSMYGLVKQYLDASYTNTQFGLNALPNAELGGITYNTATGVSSLQQCVSGNFNVGVGANSLYQCISGNYNTGVGYNAGNTSVQTVGLAISTPTFVQSTPTFTGSVSGNSSISISPNGNSIIFCNGTTTLYYGSLSGTTWTISTYTTTGINASFTATSVVAYASNVNRIVVGSGTTSVTNQLAFATWTGTSTTAPTGFTLFDTVNRGCYLTAAKITADGTKLVVITSNPSYILYYTWNGSTYTLLSSSTPSGTGIPNTFNLTGVTMNTAGTSVYLSDSGYGTIYSTVWGSSRLTPIYNPNSLSFNVTSIKISPDNNILYIGGQTDASGVYYTTWNQSLQNFNPTITPFSTIPSGTIIYSMDVDGSGNVYATSTGNTLYKLVPTYTVTPTNVYVDTSATTFVGTNTNMTTYSSSRITNSTAIGYGATITGNNQIVLGTSAETILIPGAISTYNTSYNTGFGISALGGKLSGYNTAIGYNAGTATSQKPTLFPNCILYYPLYTDILNYASGIGMAQAKIVGTAPLASLNTSVYKIGSGSLASAPQTAGASLSYLNMTANYTIPANQNGYTFAFWLDLSAATGGIVFTLAATAAANQTRVYIYNNGTNLGIGSNNGSTFYSTNTTITTSSLVGGWNHIVWTLDRSNNNNVYLNGSSTASYTSTAVNYVSSTFGSSCLFGDSYNNAYGAGSIGYIQDFRYYDAVLTTTQLRTIYQYSLGTVESTNCTFLGAYTNANATGYSQSTAVGYGAQISSSNQIVLGTTSEITSVPGRISNAQFTEPLNTNISWAASLSINSTNGFLYYVSGGTAVPITTLALTLPTTITNTSYTFTFFLNAPGATANFINTTTAFTINGTAVTLRGNTSISLTSATNLILQQVTAYNISGTFYALTTANGF